MNEKVDLNPVRAFFLRSDVKALQEIQKRNPYGSPEHKAAHEEMAKLAKEVGGDIGGY